MLKLKLLMLRSGEYRIFLNHTSDPLSTPFICNIFHSHEQKLIDLYVKFPLLLPNFNQNWNVMAKFCKLPNSKCNKLLSVSQVQTFRQAQTVKLISINLQIFGQNVSKEKD